MLLIRHCGPLTSKALRRTSITSGFTLGKVILMSGDESIGVKATALAVSRLKPGAVKYEVSIEGHPGLVLRVWPSGERTFLYRHRQDGHLRRIALQADSLSEAIAEWGRERRDARQGVDVASRRSKVKQQTRLDRIDERRHPTLAEFAGRYIEEYARRHKRSWQADQRMLSRLVVPDLGTLKLKDVRRADVHSLIHRIARKTPIQANRVLAVTRKLFSFAMDAGVIETHPCLRMTAPSAEMQRDRVLNDDEIRAIWSAAPEVLHPTVRDALRLQLLTACRISEVVGSDSSEFELESRLWTIPGSRTKNKRDHVLPLTDSALAVVRERAVSGSLFPWPTSNGRVPADVVSHHIISAVAALKMQHFTSHDLRRTVATRLSQLGIGRETRERVLNHKDLTVMGKHYDKYDGLREKRDALASWEAQLLGIVGKTSQRKVVSMRRSTSR